MKTYNVLIIGPEHETRNITLGEFEFEQLKEINMQDGDFKACCHKLIDADIIITLNEWQTDRDSSALLAMARILNKSVVPNSNFVKYVQQLND